MTTPSSGRTVILCGMRTPFTRAGSAFASVSATDLARAAFVETLASAEIDPERVDEVILGCAGQPPEAQNLARVAALRAGIPERVPALTVHRNCASGMEALTQAALRIQAGRGGVYLVGGVEAMSRGLVLFSDAAAGWLQRLARARTPLAKARAFLRVRPSMLKPRIGLLEGLTDPVSGLIMGLTAEVLARDFGISREEQDAYALESHRRAQAAREQGILGEELAPILALPSGKKFVSEDNGIRPDLTEAQLQRLPPYFDRKTGTVTVGNACQITDGAAALLVASERRADELGIPPLGFLRDHAYAGLDPARMGLGPVYATHRLLERTGGKLQDFQRVELNEAFAAQVLACERAFSSDSFARQHLGIERALGPLPREITNVNGGAIALGHPVGATGLRLVLTLLLQLRRAGMRRGLATLCVGGGQGAALDLEAA